MNKIFQRIIFFLISFVLIGACYAEEPVLIPVENPSERISDPNTGLSILPPSGEGWSIIANYPNGGIHFGKMIYLPSHTWACTLIVIPIERSFQNGEEFLKFVKQMINADTGKNRFKHIKSNYQLSKRFSSFSIEHRMRATDMWLTSTYGRPVFLNVHGSVVSQYN